MKASKRKLVRLCRCSSLFRAIRADRPIEYFYRSRSNGVLVKAGKDKVGLLGPTAGRLASCLGRDGKLVSGSICTLEEGGTGSVFVKARKAKVGVLGTTAKQLRGLRVPSGCPPFGTICGVCFAGGSSLL